MRGTFVYCEACGWEGIDLDDCPECGAATSTGGVVV